MFSAQDIDRIITTPREHERLEFKEAKQQYDTEALFRYCVALSNEGGGLLLLGITDKQPRKVEIGANDAPLIDGEAA